MIGVDLQHLRTRIGYVVRPYDMLADRRRWRWQRPAQCGFGQLSQADRERLTALVLERLGRG